jgi:hypothetical protein
VKNQGYVVRVHVRTRKRETPLRGRGIKRDFFDAHPELAGCTYAGRGGVGREEAAWDKQECGLGIIQVELDVS